MSSGPQQPDRPSVGRSLARQEDVDVPMGVVAPARGFGDLAIVERSRPNVASERFEEASRMLLERSEILGHFPTIFCERDGFLALARARVGLEHETV